MVGEAVGGVSCKVRYVVVLSELEKSAAQDSHVAGLNYTQKEHHMAVKYPVSLINMFAINS